MTPKTTPTRLSKLLGLSAVLLILLTACAPDEPEATQIPIARATATYTAVPTTTNSPTETPVPTSAVRPDTPTPTETLIPTQPPTTIPLPLPPLAPFPTVTPNYRLHWYRSPDSIAKSIFLQVHSWGGDGAASALQTPSIIIYGDGTVLIRESDLYWESALTALEMCALWQQIADTGFLEPHTEEEYYTQRAGFDGAGYTYVLVGGTFYEFYYPDIPYLVDELTSGFNLIQNYRPRGEMTPFIPNAYAITIYEDMYEYENVPDWPSELPPLSEFWPDRSQTGYFVLEGEWASIYHDLVHTKISAGPAIQDSGKYYRIYSRPILPHETPHHEAYFSNPPQNYIPTIDCQDEPAFIPTPTPIPPIDPPALSGLGRISFVAEGPFQVSQEIFISEADGMNRFQLTNNRDFDGEPSWSPDGQRIAFVSDRNRNMDIFVMDITGQNITQLTTHQADDLSPTWSPDGTKIAFTSQRTGSLNNTEIYLINADGTGEEQLTSNQLREYRPVWSPDGRKLAFVLEDAIREERLAVLDIETGQIEILMTETVQSVSRPTWSPDNTQIAVGIDTNMDEGSIQIFNLENGQTDEILLGFRQFPNGLDWSSDGRFIIFSAWQQYQDGDLISYYESQSHLGSFNLYALDTTTNQIIQITFNQQDETSPAWWP